MWYNDSVSILKRTIPQVLIVPAFLAFQIVSRPLMLCVAGPCEMQRCEMSKIEAQKLCVAVNDKPAPAGRCAQAEKRATPAKSSPCGGCGEREATPSKTDFSCGMDNAKETKSRPAGCDEKSDKCPFASTTCSPCLPIPVFAEPTVKLATRVTYDQTFILIGQASRAMVEADRQRVFLHAHAPPSFIPARAGPQICIENCSFLI
jgi:hypothetical protein